MACWICLPTCDKCKPKYFNCPNCGGLAFFALDKCPCCGYVPTEDDQNNGLEAWNLKHSSNAQQASRANKANMPEDLAKR